MDLFPQPSTAVHVLVLETLQLAPATSLPVLAVSVLLPQASDAVGDENVILVGLQPRLAFAPTPLIVGAT